jgi:selenide,water dikinase
VGLNPPDDAAVYRIDDEQAIIGTADFFPPVVDEPYDYGAIAAANAMSDVYAMGGEVLYAINIVCFPENLPLEILTEILRGGAEKVAEAGAVVVGGHTIADKEPKYGLAVTGLVPSDGMITKAGARPGDVLVLSKSLGVGIVTTVLKSQAAKPEHVAAAVSSMTVLNRAASRAMVAAGAHAATDITGFALLGHASEMAEHGGVRLCFSKERLPFVEGAHDYAMDWLFPAGSHNNRAYYGPGVEFSDGISEEEQVLLFTPETSGGLLIALAPESLKTFQKYCAEEGQEAWEVGWVEEGAGVRVEL